MGIGKEHWGYKLGKKPARPDAILFRLTSYVNVEMPKPPAHFRAQNPPPWELWGNEQYGNCVWVGAANETRLWESEAGLAVAPFTVENVLADYSAVAGFNLNDPSTDVGTDMGDAAAYRRKVGIVDARGERHVVDAYAKVRLRNIDILKVAIWTLGGVGLGFKFPSFAMGQFEARQPWDVQRGYADVDGGHYVAAIGIAPNGNIITVTWGREQEMTPAFYNRYADEVVAYLDLDRLSQIGRLSPEGFDEQRLRRDLGLVSEGRVHAVSKGPGTREV